MPKQNARMPKQTDRKCQNRSQNPVRVLVLKNTESKAGRIKNPTGYRPPHSSPDLLHTCNVLFHTCNTCNRKKQAIRSH
jgi:hypothetical protein